MTASKHRCRGPRAATVHAARCSCIRLHDALPARRSIGWRPAWGVTASGYTTAARELRHAASLYEEWGAAEKVPLLLREMESL